MSISIEPGQAVARRQHGRIVTRWHVVAAEALGLVLTNCGRELLAEAMLGRLEVLNAADVQGGWCRYCGPGAFKQ